VRAALQAADAADAMTLQEGIKMERCGVGGRSGEQLQPACRANMPCCAVVCYGVLRRAMSSGHTV
jgi:hypothetical protein